MSEKLVNELGAHNVDVHTFERRYIFWGSYISILEGKILTQLEASIVDREQLKALKSIFRDMLWKWADETSWCDDCQNGKLKDKLPFDGEAKFKQYHCKRCNCFYDK